MNNELIIPKRINKWAEANPRIKELTESAYGTLLKEAYEMLDTSVLYKSLGHGIAHIERTMLFGALIAQNFSLNAENTRELLLCCSYHDIGRLDDSYDVDHGMRSAQMISECYINGLFNHSNASKCAIAAHSIPDTEMRECSSLFGNTELEYFNSIAPLLKDADNLDRVRICDLDTRHLRSESSKEMAELAEWILLEYTKKYTVVCYGDSNTYGYNPKNGLRYPESVRWTSILQEYLGQEYDVINEGLNGRTTAYKKSGSVWKSGLYSLESVLASDRPVDCVVFMLGTNDCAAELDLDAEQICGSMEKLIDRSRELLKELQGYEPSVILVAPPEIRESVFSGKFADEMNEKSIAVSSRIPALYRKLAKKSDCIFCDLSEKTQFSDLDSEHLDPRGHFILAFSLGKIIKELSE